MEARAVHAYLSAGRARKPHNSWLEQLVFGLDAVLRRWHSVIEFTPDPHCILRINIGQLDHNIVLSDGTRGHIGDRIIDLHLWNEQIPPMPNEGASIAWGRQMHRCFLRSLRELARYLALRPDLDDVSVLRANMAFGGREQNGQRVRLIGRYGFEPVPGATMVARGTRRFGENVLISLMVLAHSTAALRRDTLRRGRTPVFLSRRVLEQRYGPGARWNEP